MDNKPQFTPTTKKLFRNGHGYAGRVIEELRLSTRLTDAMWKAGFDPAQAEMTVRASNGGGRCYQEVIHIACDNHDIGVRAGKWLLAALKEADIQDVTENADMAQPPRPLNLLALVTRPAETRRGHVPARPAYVGVTLFTRFSGDLSSSPLTSTLRPGERP